MKAICRTSALSALCFAATTGVSLAREGDSDSQSRRDAALFGTQMLIALEDNTAACLETSDPTEALAWAIKSVSVVESLRTNAGIAEDQKRDALQLVDDCVERAQSLSGVRFENRWPAPDASVVHKVGEACLLLQDRGQLDLRSAQACMAPQ